MSHRLGIDFQPDINRVQQRREHRFDQHAQSKTRQRDAQLGRADRRVQVADQLARDLRPAMSFEDEHVELRVADLHQRQFRRYKKAVQHHQRADGEQIEQDRQGGFFRHGG